MLVEGLFVGHLRLAVLNRLFSDRLADQTTELARFGDGWQKDPPFVLLRGQVMCQFRSRGLDHHIGDAPCFGRDDSESEPGKNVRVIGLRDVNRLSTNIYRLERAAGANQRASFRPVHQVLRSSFAARGGIRQRKDDGTGRMLRHFTHCFFGKSPRLAGYADKHRRLRIANHVGECDFSVLRAPAFNFLLFPCVRQLLGTHILAVFGNQAVSIDCVEVAAGFFWRDGPVLNELRQQVGDADTGGSESNNHDLLLLKRNARDVDGRDQRCGSHSRSTLNVIVEGAELVSVAGQ